MFFTTFRSALEMNRRWHAEAYTNDSMNCLYLSFNCPAGEKKLTFKSRQLRKWSVYGVCNFFCPAKTYPHINMSISLWGVLYGMLFSITKPILAPTSTFSLTFQTLYIIEGRGTLERAQRIDHHQLALNQFCMLGKVCVKGLGGPFFHAPCRT